MTLSSKTKGLLAGGLVLLLVGGAAFAFISHRTATPASLLSAMAKTSSASPFSVSADIQATDAGDATNTFSATVHAENIGGPAAQGTVKLDGALSEDSGALSASFEWRRVAPNTYLKLAPGIKIPEFPFDAELFTNRWIVLSDTDTNGGAESIVSDLSPVSLPSCSSEKLRTAFTQINPSVFSDVKETSTVAISEAPAEQAIVYAVIVDADALQTSFQQALKEAGCETTNAQNGLANIKNLTVSVGEKTGYIRAISGDVMEDGTQMHADVTFGNFGTAVSVEEPVGAVTFEQLVNEAFSSMFGGANALPF